RESSMLTALRMKIGQGYQKSLMSNQNTTEGSDPPMDREMSSVVGEGQSNVYLGGNIPSSSIGENSPLACQTTSHINPRGPILTSSNGGKGRTGMNEQSMFNRGGGASTSTTKGMSTVLHSPSNIYQGGGIPSSSTGEIRPMFGSGPPPIDLRGVTLSSSNGENSVMAATGSSVVDVDSNRGANKKRQIVQARGTVTAPKKTYDLRRAKKIKKEEQ
ncbi:hypothetical protein PFISCL1PPCAC_190, partial [Pristionchus fissidentatus]